MDGYVVIGTDLDTKSFDAQIDYVKGQLDDIEDKLKQADMGFEVGDVQKLEAQYEKLTDKLRNLIRKKEELNKTDLSNFQNGIENIGNSTSKVIKRVAKWGLAVFGIRSAYNFVRQSISTLAGENEQLASDVEYIRYAIASTLQPVIERLIQLVYKLLQYVNYLAQAWFGVNIFANANAKAMNKAVGSAKQLHKQLAGFDEMNVLSDTGSGAGGAGATPSVDLSQMQGDVPEWIKWLGENGNMIIAILGGIAGAILAIKFGASGLLGLGIGIAIAGLILLIQDVIKFIQDPSWEGFANILRDLAIVLAGVAVAMIAFNATNPIGWIMLAISAVALLTSAIIKNWDKIKAFFKSAVDWIKSTFNTVITFFSNLISKIVGLFKEIGTKVADVLGGAFKGVINGVLSAIESILNFPIRQVNKLLDIINKVPGINISKLSTFSLPRLAKGGIVNMPGRGVPIGGAIAGEAGREAVLPLQDSQVLDEIADAIGRRIVLQPTIPVYVGGRQVSRVTRKIDAEEKFAYNE
jgi:hypothetical protein